MTQDQENCGVEILRGELYASQSHRIRHVASYPDNEEVSEILIKQ